MGCFGGNQCWTGLKNLKKKEKKEKKYWLQLGSCYGIFLGEPVEVQDFRRVTNHLEKINEIYLK